MRESDADARNQEDLEEFLVEIGWSIHVFGVEVEEIKHARREKGGGEGRGLGVTVGEGPNRLANETIVTTTNTLTTLIGSCPKSKRY
jgi:hypothetical protein